MNIIILIICLLSLAHNIFLCSKLMEMSVHTKITFEMMSRIMAFITVRNPESEVLLNYYKDIIDEEHYQLIIEQLNNAKKEEI